MFIIVYSDKMPTKLMLKMTDEEWKEVKKFKIEHEFRTNNEAVVELIKLGLEKANSAEKGKPSISQNMGVF